MTGLHLAPDLTLPDRFATEGVAVIGVRGSGKTNTEVTFVEALHDAGIPFVAVDPKGDWYGIRSSGDGKGPGLPIPVFGGLYGDFPLEDTLGERIADLLVNENLSAVLDVSRLAKTTALPKFLTAFCNQLMDRHQREPHVRCVILEEAHRYIPQQIGKGLMPKLKEAAASLLLEGRAFGLGCWACTQRPARLHKDVLEEVDTAIIHRIGVTATNDLRTVRAWVKHEDLGDEVSESLTKLANGEAWVLSPTSLGIVQRVKINRRTTFDSAATPLVGASARPQATMADIDAAAIKEALGDAIEKAKADDPAELRRQIRDLEKQVAHLGNQPANETIVEVKVPVEVVPKGLIDALGSLLEHHDHMLGALSKARTALVGVKSLAEDLDRRGAIRADSGAKTPPKRAENRAIRADSAPIPARSAPIRPDPGSIGDVKLGKGERTVLDVLAEYPEGRTYNELAFLAGYSAKASTLGVILSNLRKAGLVEPGNQPVRPTPEGLDAAGGAKERPTGQALLDQWLRHPRIGEGERKVLLCLIDAYPEDLTHDELCERTGYSSIASTMGVILSKLRKLGLVDKGRRRTADEFMEAIA